MQKLIVGIVTAFIVKTSTRVGAEELNELKSQIEQLKETIASQQEEQKRQKLEAEKKYIQLQETLEKLHQQMEVLMQKKDQKLPTETKNDSLLSSLLSDSKTKAPKGEMTPLARRHHVQHSTPSGGYADPASFFFLHGYVTLTYADFEKGFGSVPGSTSQILVTGTSSRSNKHESGFRNDSCLFIGSEVSETLKGVVELHLVGNALDPVITESKITWTPLETSEDRASLRIIAGRYWWPFGIHNAEWFSSENQFNLLSPVAAEVVPAHYNELGIMAEGEWQFAEKFGMNYLLSIGNGVSSFELSDNTGSSNAFDLNSNRVVTIRLGFLPWVEDLEMGVNFAHGGLRRGADTSYAASDARRYEADLMAYGFDASYQLKDLMLRSYWYFSEEDLGNAPLDSLDRNGGTLEVLYTILKDVPLLGEVDFKTRVSTATDATLTNGTFRRSQYGFGFNARPNEHFFLKTEYFIEKEGEGIPEADNNGVSMSGTIGF